MVAARGGEVAGAAVRVVPPVEVTTRLGAGGDAVWGGDADRCQPAAASFGRRKNNGVALPAQGTLATTRGVIATLVAAAPACGRVGSAATSLLGLPCTAAAGPGADGADGVAAGSTKPPSSSWRKSRTTVSGCCLAAHEAAATRSSGDCVLADPGTEGWIVCEIILGEVSAVVQQPGADDVVGTALPSTSWTRGAALTEVVTETTRGRTSAGTVTLNADV